MGGIFAAIGGGKMEEVCGLVGGLSNLSEKREK